MTKLSLLFALSFFLYSCGNEVLIDQNLELESKSWKVDQPFEMDFATEDTVSNYNFFITLRNTDDYQYRNLFVFITTTFPNGRSSVDTVNCPLADLRGSWLGKGFAGVYDNRILYIARKRFPLQGEYHIKMEQAMRDEELFGILDAGIRIERSN